MSAAVLSVSLLLCLSPALADSPPRRGHLEPFGHQGPRGSIDQVDGFLPPKKFFEDFVQKNRPLLFKGAAKHSPAFQRWTDEYLAEKTPPRPIGDVFIEHNKKENRSQKYGYVHFKEFLKVYNTSNIYMVSELPKNLLQDLVLPHSLQCRSFLRGGLDTYVAWFSSGGTSSVIHHDSYENINCLYRGRKTLVFVNTTKYPDQTTKIIDREDGAFSSVDVDKIDLDKRPEFEGLEYQFAEMETGDCLYIPFLWVHQVRSFENNLAVNLWWPLLDKYNLKKCSKEFNTKITFDKVMFRTLIKQAHEDAENIRQTVNFNVKTVESFDRFLAAIVGDSSEFAANSDFVDAARRLFKALDMDGDGRLTDQDYAMDMKRKHFEPLVKAANDYNAVVFRLSEEVRAAGGDTARLPKLLKTATSDDGFFTADRTMSTAKESDEDELGADAEDEHSPLEDEHSPLEDEHSPLEDEQSPLEDEQSAPENEDSAGSAESAQEKPKDEL